MPLPTGSVEQHVTNATPFFWASSICLDTAARLTALRITASAPLRIAVSNAPCSFSGDPSVAIVDADQPRSLAPWAMILPWTLQASTPQLMKAIFLPAGTVLPTGSVTPIVVGRVLACLTTDSASATPAGVLLALAALAFELVVLLLLLPQPAATMSAAATVASSAVMRSTRTGERRWVVMMTRLLLWSEWDGPACGGDVRVGRGAAGQAARAVFRRRRARSPIPPRRCRPVTASAAMRTMPTNMSPAHCGALARARPVVPVPSSRTAMIVPPALNRPCLICVAPRKAAAKPGSRYGVPAVGEPLASVEASTMPLKPASPPEATSDRNRRRSTRTPPRRAASGLKPVAYSRRPVAVWSSRYQMASATAAK